MSTAIVWFRRDLRLADNPALNAAIRAGHQIIPLFVHAPDEEAPWAPGAASQPASMLAAPAVKLIMAGTRPAETARRPKAKTRTLARPRGHAAKE